MSFVFTWHVFFLLMYSIVQMERRGFFPMHSNVSGGLLEQCQLIITFYGDKVTITASVSYYHKSANEGSQVIMSYPHIQPRTPSIGSALCFQNVC